MQAARSSLVSSLVSIQPASDKSEDELRKDNDVYESGHVRIPEM